MAKSGRSREDFQMFAPVFVVTGADEAEMTIAATASRKQIAFYASTPAYRKVLELHGWGELQTELHQLSMQGQWDTMGTLIDDEMLNTFAVVAPMDPVGRSAAGSVRRDHRPCHGRVARGHSGIHVRAFLDEVRAV